MKSAYARINSNLTGEPVGAHARFRKLELWATTI